MPVFAFFFCHPHLQLITAPSIFTPNEISKYSLISSLHQFIAILTNTHSLCLKLSQEPSVGLPVFISFSVSLSLCLSVQSLPSVSPFLGVPYFSFSIAALTSASLFLYLCLLVSVSLSCLDFISTHFLSPSSSSLYVSSSFSVSLCLYFLSVCLLICLSGEQQRGAQLRAPADLGRTPRVCP